MAVTRKAPTGARAVLAATWQARVLDTGAVQDELTRLWAELGDPGCGGDGAGEVLDAHPRSGSGAMLTRANTLNLLAVANSDAEATRVETAIHHLTDFYPSRAIIFHTHAVPDDQRGGGLDVRVALLEQAALRNRPVVRFESITVSADSSRADHLASVASPLLVAELPDFLWWPGDSPSRNSLFTDLAGLVDHLIVDTASFADQPRELAFLAKLARASDNAFVISDFAWARLAPWRQLTAQFFDMVAVQPCLDCLDEVAIDYAVSSDDMVSGFSAALLAASWLATRLGWESIDRLEPSGGGWWAPLRAHTGSRRRDVTLRLRPGTSETAVHSLSNLKLTARGEAAGTFAIERISEPALTTSSETPTMPKVSRMVYTRPFDDAVLLGNELSDFNRDRVFEEALNFAATLLPESDTSR
ncbi:MAG: glucose-6-phosphate dehydrogenase assembly protein OpcA [Chloroflexia bacterium]|nr:glucose-6-phosphate dehydrogenase assembly protein OpcA [Chloroflexia bacterium]